MSKEVLHDTLRYMLIITKKKMKNRVVNNEKQSKPLMPKSKIHIVLYNFEVAFNFATGQFTKHLFIQKLEWINIDRYLFVAAL